MNYWECLPQETGAYLATLNNVRELRLRDGKGIRINVDGKWFWLGDNKLLKTQDLALQFPSLCDSFVKRACNKSVYAYEKMLAQGYFTFSDGTRVGVCGTMGASGVFQKYTSLCVRTACNVNCAERLFDDSVIVVGAPRSGKTTYLRDLACKLSQMHNVVIADERGEISGCQGFEAKSCCDVFLYASKRYAFEVAVRSMSPDWLVCDELSEDDLRDIPNVLSAGVKLAASIHATDMDELRYRLGNALTMFTYAVFLEKDTFKQSVVSLKDNSQNNGSILQNGGSVLPSDG